MKGIIVVFLFMGISLFYFGCTDNPSAPGLNQNDQVTATLDKKTAPTLNCTTEYFFMGALGITDDDGRLLGWEGPIHGDIEGIIQWWMDGTTMVYTGQASHYVDRYVIWNEDKTEKLLVGDEAGSTTARLMKNSNWRTNGTVTEAYGDFENWLGGNNHAAGHFTWIEVVEDVFAPEHGYGTFRIN
ncbi:hypothetical protein LJE86_18220 [bacterium BMS3Abin03]|nr:hypothetical protein [bacterium BMS3Abin03]